MEEQKVQIHLEDKAMLVSLSIGVWGATKTDRKISEDTNRRYAARDNASKVVKKLVENAFPRTKSVRSRARDFHKFMTLPWEDEAHDKRLLPGKLFWDYMNRMKDFEREFEKAMLADIEEWPYLITKASRTLGNMFKREDYPTPLELKSKFYFRSSATPLPSASTFGGFITELGQDAVDELAAKLEARLQASSTAAFREITTNFFNLVKELAGKLNDPGYTPKDGMVSSLTKYMTMLPALDYTNNPDLDTLRREVEGKLLTLDPGVLRNNDAERAKAAATTQDIMDKMGAFWKN